MVASSTPQAARPNRSAGRTPCQPPPRPHALAAALLASTNPAPSSHPLQAAHPDQFRVDYALSREGAKNKRGGKMYIQDKVEEYAGELGGGAGRSGGKVDWAREAGTCLVTAGHWGGAQVLACGLRCRRGGLCAGA